MKRFLMIGLIFVTTLAILCGGSSLKADYQPLSIKSITCTNGLDPEHTPYLMLDDDSGTAWRTTAGSPVETGLEINLSARARILGLKLTCTETSFDRLVVEFNDHGTWRPFTGQTRIKPTISNMPVTIDLSYDNVQTDLLRLHIYNNNNQYSYLGSIAKLEVFGIPDVEETLIPIDTIDTPNSQDLFKVNNLYDGNTNSNWETTPDGSGSASFILNFPLNQVNRLKLYVGTTLKGTLALSYWQNNKWLTVSGANKITSLSPGWSSITLNGVTTTKLRGVFTNPLNGRLGGISETEIWGVDSGDSKTIYDSGLTSGNFDGSSAILSTKVSLPQVDQRSKYNLILATTGQAPGLVNFNGSTLSLGQPFAQNNQASPVSLYKIPVQPVNGHTDEFNSSTLDPSWSWVRENKANWSLTANSGALTINTEYGELQSTDNNMKNILLRQAPADDWTISAKINATFDNSYEQAGIIVYQDDDNYILMEAKYDYGQKFLCWKETGGQTIGEYFHNATIPNPCYFKIIKLGNNYQCFYSADNVIWNLVKLWQGVNFSNIKIGLIASNGYAYSRPAFQSSVQFDWFNLDNGFRHPGGVNSVALDGTQAGEVAAVTIEADKPNGLLTNWTTSNGNGLNDGLLFTPAVTTNQVDLNFDTMVQLDRVTLYCGDALNQVQIQANGTNGWTPVTVSQTQTTGACRIYFNSGVATQKLRIILPATVSLNEIQCWGSPITQGAPQLTINLPVEDQVLHPYDHTFQIIGRVDQPNTTVTVNGTLVTMQGEQFSATLCPWQDNPVFPVTITARNQQNQTITVNRTVFLNPPPLLALDQTASEYLVKDTNFTVSGTVGNANLNVTVNGISVKLSGLKFNQAVSIKEGQNLIAVKAVDNKGLFTNQTITVYRDSQPPQLNVLNPINNQTSNAASLTVSGTVADSSGFSVTINGSAATVSGANFSGVVNLAVGANVITVTAQDKLGNVSTLKLNVKYIKSQPVLTVSYPTNNLYVNSGKIAVKGTVSDTLPVMVDVNNVQGQITGTNYQTNLTLLEGWNTLLVRATNETGVQTSQTLKVLVDETKPLEFTVTASPADWANTNQPVLTFATTDQISGVDHYELAVDDQAFTKVTSPFKLPVTPDGEHTITVKAIDKVGWETIETTKVYIDTTPPAAVTEFKAVPGNQKVIVSWKPNTDPDLKAYVLKRVPAFPSGSEKALGPDIKEYIDTEVVNLQSYTYSIKALDHIDLVSSVSTAPKVKPGLAEMKVNPTVETKIEYENVVVGIPVGALSQTKTITITEVSKNQADPLIQKTMALNVSSVYSFSAETAQGSIDPAGVQFDKPVLVGIHFELKDAYTVLKKSNLRAYYYNYQDNNWEVIPESYVDGDKNIVYFFTKHFSMFSVQASLAAPTSPEQISNMGISPGKSYFQNNQVGISYGGGTATVTAKDFVLPGRGGLDLTISRTYDSATGQSDWGIDEKNILSAACGFIDFGNAFFNFIANLVASQVDHYLSQPSGSCGFGRGWRMNFVWVEKNENGQFVHLPGGSLKKINWSMDGTGWGGQGHGRFECHAGEHFVLEQFQEFVNDVYSNDDNNGATKVKIGENWRATSYTLTTKDGTKYYMDGDGKITRIVNRLGTSEINFYYNGKKLDHIIDSVSRRIQFLYNGKFVSSITGAGKTVNYYYDDDLQELQRVVDGGLQETKYHYVHESLRMGSQTVSLISIVTDLLSGPAGWVSLFLSLLPSERTDDVYYLDQVTTPFDGEYQITYTKYDAIRYSEIFAGFSIIGYEFSKATRLQELGSPCGKDLSIDYNIAYNNDQPPLVFTCDVLEGKSPFRPDGRKKTHMLFARYSNSIDKDTSMLKEQTITGEDGRLISTNVVDVFDQELEAPLRVIDETRSQQTVQEMKYDNWGNVVWQTNSHTKVEAYYTYANTNAPPINQTKALTSPYGNQTLDGNIHDAKTGELILNYNGSNCIPQQTTYKYGTNGNLLEKAVRSGSAWPIKTKYVYDGFGNIVTMTSPSAVDTYYEYSPDYQQALLTKVTLSKLTAADGQVQNNVVLKEVAYDPLTYNKRWEKDARGFVTEYQYDTIGREVKTVLPDDDDDLSYRPTVLTGAIDQSGLRSNNPVQQVIFQDSDKKTTVIDPMGNQTDYLYDAFEHLLEIDKYQKGFLDIPYVYSRVQVSYDQQGNIAQIISPEGCQNPGVVEKYTTSYQYDEMNRLTKINYPKTNDTDALNPCKVYYFNDISNEEMVTDENYNETIIRKDPVGRVIEQVAGSRSANQVLTKYTYDSLGNKTSETIDDTITTTFVYNDLNQLVQKILPSEEMLNDPTSGPVVQSPVYRYTYDLEGNLVQETSPLGTVITHVYDEMNREIRTESHFTGMNNARKDVVSKTFYDLAGNKLQVVDPNGKTTEFTYTAQGWLATKKDASGMTSFTYDKVGNKISETDPRGHAPGAVANSYTAWYYYDDLYRVIKGVLPDQTPPSDPKNPGDNPVISFEYDRNGNCTLETKPNNQTISYAYNGRNWLVSQTQSLNNKNYATRFEYYDNGNKKYIYDNKNNQTEFKYDALNRLELEIYPEGNTTQYEYDNRGNKHIIRDGNQHATTYDYDNLNRLHQVTDVYNGITTNWYNEEGRLTKTISPTGLVTRIYPNEVGLPLQVVDSLGQQHTFDYDAAGNTIYKKDPRGTETRFTYDDLYRVLRMDLQNGNRKQYQSFDYDQAGNVKQVDNGQVQLIYNNALTSYDSDPFNRIKKVEQVMPDGSRYATEYQYDQMGQMTGIRYPGSQDWLNYDYDSMGRLLAIPGFAGTRSNPGFDYDENSALKMIKTDNGITTSVPDIGGRDMNGRLKQMTIAKKNGDQILNLSYDYDKNSNIVRRNDNTYSYDDMNRLDTAIIRGAFEDKFTKADMRMGTANQDYNGSKNPEEDVTDQTQIKLDHSARSLVFNLQTDAENVSRIDLVPEVTGHRVPVDQLEIYYKRREGDFAYSKLDRSAWTGSKDDQGRIILKFTPVLNAHLLKIHCNYEDLDLHQVPLDTLSEFYNAPEKLVTVYQKLVSRTEHYKYDAMGNRTSETILLRNEHGYTYDYYPNSNRLKSKAKDDGSEKYEYAYDENGNLIMKVVTKGTTVDTWEYSYDLWNQLEQVKKNSVIVSSYIYDPNGFRVQKQGSQGKIDYVPLLNGEVGYRKEFSTNKEYSFIYVGGQHFARVNGVIGSAGKKFFYHNDHQGNALVITDENGNKVVERDFTPFGERINTDLYKETNRDPDEDDSGFTGKDWDADNGLYYYNARFYDPEIGRFISEDSVADDPNLYGYCGQNPVNMTDPTGHVATGTGGFKIGWQSGAGLFSACLNAAADLTGDKNLSAFASAFGMFVAVENKIAQTKDQKAKDDAAKKNEPITTVTETLKQPAQGANKEVSENTDDTIYLDPEALAKTYLTYMGLNPDAVNEEWGNKSISAIIVYQSIMGLDITGTCDENTLASMKEAYDAGLKFGNISGYFTASTVDKSKLTNGKITNGLINIKGNENNGDASLLKETAVGWAYLYQTAAASDENLNLTKFNPKGHISGYRSFTQQQDMETIWKTRITNAYNSKNSSKYKSQIQSLMNDKKNPLSYNDAFNKVLRRYASTPGTSNHGWGLAIDFSFEDIDVNTPEYQWLSTNAANFGFRPITSEVWHFDYRP